MVLILRVPWAVLWAGYLFMLILQRLIASFPSLCIPADWSLEAITSLLSLLDLYPNNSASRLTQLPVNAFAPLNHRVIYRGAFSVSAGVSYGHVLLVDDVITTGSTVNELAKILRLAGVSRVDVLACARAT
jgi:hypothetical protein